MNLKLIKKIAIINIFLLSFLSHFIYTFFPNILISFFFPVNESIWEHMKILFTTTIIYSIFDYLLLKKNNIKFNNFLLQLTITSILSIIIFLILYLPTNYIIGENFPITLILMLITYTICQYISYKFLKTNHIPILNYLSIALIIIIYLLFIYLTYNPPKTPLFYDKLNNHYSIKRTYSSLLK